MFRDEIGYDVTQNNLQRINSLLALFFSSYWMTAISVADVPNKLPAYNDIIYDMLKYKTIYKEVTDGARGKTQMAFLYIEQLWTTAQQTLTRSMNRMKYRVKLKALNKSSDGPINGSLQLINAWQKNKKQWQKKTERNGQEIKKPKVKMTSENKMMWTSTTQIKNMSGGHGIQENLPNEPYQKETSPIWACRSPTLVVAYLVSQVTNSQPGITYSQPHNHQE